ncbi:H/ACA ribonucleoprotein complex subunit 2 [Pleurostoma richardsiae]|uniref:H/ACA ribonucleoprotein complex subunit 2 n=1 Tax=Pleurostoma richardsiae TaxID=41990 RepID=A0AA38VZY8_9PEZI|nr:H/ACA ribonucleoprotein complex subunit 2 [Pleurostoma richardsiae]
MASEEEVRTKDKSKKDKKEKKDKKRSETDGVKKPKKDKKDKKSKDEKLKKKVEAALEEQLQADVAKSAPAAVEHEESDDDHSDAEDAKNTVVEKNLVYFALPMADDKGHKKIFKTIKKARKAGALQRGVKEVNKALRKTPLKTPSATAAQIPGVVIIAGDISPDEVIMHLPVFCEEHNVPYLFVRSRLDLGTAAKTKRPTSVVFLTEKGKAPKAGADTKMGAGDDDEEDAGDYAEAYKELLKLAQKEYTKQMKSVLINGTTV